MSTASNDYHGKASALSSRQVTSPRLKQALHCVLFATLLDMHPKQDLGRM